MLRLRKVGLMNLKAVKKTGGIWILLMVIFLLIHFFYIIVQIKSDNRVIVDDALLVALFLYLNTRFFHLKLLNIKKLSLGELLRINSFPLVLYFFYIVAILQYLPLTNFANFLDAILLALSAAVFEEIFFRGLLINSFLANALQNYRSYLQAILFSSFLFGVTHMINLFGQSLSATLLQATNAFAIGMMLGAIYLRTGNLSWTILFHFMLDFTGILVSGTIITATPTSQKTVAVLIIDVLYIALGLLLSRKSQILKQRL